MPGDDRWVLLFAAESATGLHLHDPDALGGQSEECGQRLVDVVRALHRAPDGHAVSRTCGREHPVRLDVELFLSASLVLAVHDNGVAGERRIDIAARYKVLLEDVVGAPDD